MAYFNEIPSNGFVFLDHTSRPFKVMRYGKDQETWMFYWHPDKKWVTLRPLNEFEISNIKIKCRILSDSEQTLYDNAESGGKVLR